LQNQTEIDSPFTPPEDRTFVARPGGLFKVDSSSNPPSPAEPEPKAIDPVQDPVQDTVVPEIAQETMEQVSAPSVENPSACPVEKVQLEFSWQAEKVAEALPVIQELLPLTPPVVPMPVEIPVMAAPEISPAVAATSVVAPVQTAAESDNKPSSESAPLYRSNADVVALLKKRQACWTRHPRRYRQT
jgi:hypothetical protein